ncbi:DUF4350 domain-containing protein [Nocardioides sp.]|uniref:DUF4350 domain-containing protein n=1 Tax=Nocardioides sp. TaxID=35761 RepID=UPI002737297C|nr:DUF4350 domain-containing protein [Nocardioides sp.]MDP3892034.1 DUF4350 domain-containing protein [Nocardioides sp.]
MSTPRVRRSTLVITVGLVLAVAVVILGASGSRSFTPLDPDNPDPDGARALARVLDRQGVDVVLARGADALEEQDLGAGVTVLVTSPDQLGPSTADRLLTAARGAAVVVAAPSPRATEVLGVTHPPYSLSPRSARTADCELFGLEPGLEVAVDRTYAYPTRSGCFSAPEGHLLADAGDGLLLLGAGQILENEQITRADNAAVALRLLGQHDRLVWYVPDATDLVGEDEVSLTALLPAWLHPGLLLLGLVALAGIWWRGRRLGPLEVEPLPVTIRATETTRSRGRLYRRAGDRGHAAEVLREAARRHLAARLRLPAGSTTTDLVPEVTRVTGRPTAAVEQLLAGPPPPTDHDLISLATALATLEREVRP